MNVQSIVRKLELNESAISTILGGLVLFAVGFLLFNYFTNKPQPVVEINEGQDSLASLDGQISATSVTSYTVEEGDHLWGIAQKVYNDGYKWVDIARANNLPNPDIVTVGMQLNIPRTPGEKSQTALQDLQPETKPDSSQYQTKAGDHLWAIAKTTYNDGYRWVDIWEANKVAVPNPDILEIGLTLTLPE